MTARVPEPGFGRLVRLGCKRYRRGLDSIKERGLQRWQCWISPTDHQFTNASHALWRDSVVVTKREPRRDRCLGYDDW